MTIQGFRGRWAFVAGCIVPILLLFALAEGFLRLFPPRDLHPYLGEKSPLTGVFSADEDFGIGYQSLEAFARDNAERLNPYLPLGDNADSRPLWALFGNSFVQAPGMLGDTARDAVKDHRIFYLGRNEFLMVRLAQLKLLLANGLAPERVFIALMPTDMLGMGQHPLGTVHATSRGAVSYDPRRLPAPLDTVVANSRLALTGWIRTAGKQANPRFNKNTLHEGVDQATLSDLRLLFGNLARVTAAHGVPVTIILIPSHQQVARGASCGFQDQMTALLQPLGYDVCDVRASFLAQPDKTSLFVPDLHFSPAGNRILLEALLRHLRDLSSHGAGKLTASHGQPGAAVAFGARRTQD
jgi:hypothetical protein